MADFTALPALNGSMAQPGGAFQMAQQAATINGMNLDQHFKRLQAASGVLQGLNLDNNGQGISKTDWQSAVTGAMKQGILNPTEAAQLVAAGTDDPMKNAQLARTLYAGVTGHMEAITPKLTQTNFGDQLVTGQANAGAAGGAVVPGGRLGVSPEYSSAPTTYMGADGRIHPTTQGQLSGMYGGQPGSQPNGGFPVMGRGNAVEGPNMLTANPAMPPKNMLTGGFNFGTAAAYPATPPGTPAPRWPTGMPQAPGAPSGMAPAAPQAPAAPAMSIAPGQTENQAALNKAATGEFQDVVAKGNPDVIQPQMSALDEILASSQNAATGVGSNFIGNAGGYLKQVFGLDTTGLTDKQVLDKATQLLANNVVTGLGAGTDSKLEAALHATPNSAMTKEAIGATAAMAKAQLMYNKNFADAAKAWQAQGGNPTDNAAWNQFKSDYAAKAISPFVLSLGDMPASQREPLMKFIQSLPADQRAQIKDQITRQYNLGGQ